MHASKISFHRLHKFVETGTTFTPAQIAAATYNVLVGSRLAAQQTYTVPQNLITTTPPGDPVVVPFSAIGFTPQAGVPYTVAVVCMLDGEQSPASPPVTFTNSLTPAGVDTISVS